MEIEPPKQLGWRRQLQAAADFLKPLGDFIDRTKTILLTLVAVIGAVYAAFKYFATEEQLNCVSKKLEAKNQFVNALLSLDQTNRAIREKSYDLDKLTTIAAPTQDDRKRKVDLTEEIRDLQRTQQDLESDRKTAKGTDDALVCH